jgi:hypothetical protein
MTSLNIQVDDEVSTTTQQEITPMVTIVDNSTSSTPKKKKKYAPRVARRHADTIRALFNKGYSAPTIVKVTGVKLEVVYGIKHYMKRNGKLKPKPLQFTATTTGYKLATPATNEPAIVDTPKRLVVAPNTKQVGGDHYKDNKIQVWDAIHDWGLGYFSGNVIKYVARHQKKNGIEDLKKARHYLDKLIAMAQSKIDGE